MTTALTARPAQRSLPTQHILPPRAKKYAQASKAKNTIIAYTRCWKDFSADCEQMKLSALPASPETVSAYISLMADAGAKVSTINQRLAAISYFHSIAELDDPTTHPIVRVTIAGIRRVCGTAPNQKAPLVRADIHDLTLRLGDTLSGQRDAALILLGFAGAFRESELAGLQMEDLKFTADELFVNVRKSKTDQEGEGRIKRIPQLSEENAAFCPVRAMRRYLDSAEIQTGPVFRKIDRWQRAWDSALRPAAVAYILKRAVTAAGFDPKEFAGHSIRAGFVTQAAFDQIPLHEIQDVTWHKSSDMVRRYIRNQGITGARTIRKVLEG